jgi:di/tricarboxylate transporter
VTRASVKCVLLLYFYFMFEKWKRGIVPSPKSVTPKSFEENIEKSREEKTRVCDVTLINGYFFEMCVASLFLFYV